MALSARPRGSKAPTGARAPGSPSRDAERAEEDALLVGMGENAEAEAARSTREAANFIFPLFLFTFTNV